MNTNNIDEVRQKIKELEAVVDKLEATERKQASKPWPQAWDEYWYVSSLGTREKTEYSSHEFAHYRLATGNCFRTEAEALAYREWKTDPRVVARGMIERMTKFIPNGSYRILWINSEKTLKAVYGTNKNGGLCYGYGDAAKEAIQEHPDLIKVALGVITNKEEGSRIVREAMWR